MQQPITHAGIEKRMLGSTDMQVSVLGIGTNKLGTSPPAEVRRLFDYALDAGINVIDTAECYGYSEERIGQALAHRRSDYYLFTKCGHTPDLHLPDWHPEGLQYSIERSLRRLRTDYLDLVQFHTCPQHVFQRSEVIGVLQRAREQGKVRYLGYSGDRDDALCAVMSGLFDTLQITVNIADQEAIDATLPHAAARGMGVIAKHALANGAWKADGRSNDPTCQIYRKRLTALNYEALRQEPDDRMGIAVRFPVSVPGIDVALVGTTTPEHLQQNVTALAAGSLPPPQFEAIRARWQTMTWWRRGLPGSHLGWRGRV